MLLVKRCMAFIVDLAIVSMPVVFVSVALELPNIVVISIGVPLMVCRDVLKKSPGRMLFNLQVVHAEDYQSLSIGKRILRNIFYVIWPIEFFVCLLGKGKRLGDRIVKSEVIEQS